VKKFLLFFTLIFNFGCDFIRNQDNEIAKIDCPTIYFSLENNVFTEGNINSLDLDEIEYKAVLNNYAQPDFCFSENSINNYLLDLLILVEPISPKESIVELPLFAILYDNNEKVIDKQYFKIIDNLVYIESSSTYVTTELIRKIKLKTLLDKSANSIIIGFVKI